MPELAPTSLPKQFGTGNYQLVEESVIRELRDDLIQAFLDLYLKGDRQRWIRVMSKRNKVTTSQWRNLTWRPKHD